MEDLMNALGPWGTFGSGHDALNVGHGVGRWGAAGVGCGANGVSWTTMTGDSGQFCGGTWWNCNSSSSIISSISSSMIGVGPREDIVWREIVLAELIGWTLEHVLNVYALLSLCMSLEVWNTKGAHDRYTQDT